MLAEDRHQCPKQTRLDPPVMTRATVLYCVVRRCHRLVTVWFELYTCEQAMIGIPKREIKGRKEVNCTTRGIETAITPSKKRDDRCRRECCEESCVGRVDSPAKASDIESTINTLDRKNSKDPFNMSMIIFQGRAHSRRGSAHAVRTYQPDPWRYFRRLDTASEAADDTIDADLCFCRYKGNVS